MKKFKTGRDVSLIVSVDQTGGFACDDEIPWSFKEDWDHFKKVTDNTICILGRGTYEDILSRKRNKSGPLLKNRESFVVSKSLPSNTEGVTVVKTATEALNLIQPEDEREIYILGGRLLYIEFLNQAKQAWVTVIPGDYKTNKKFPVDKLHDLYTIVEGRQENDLMFVRYVRKIPYYELQFSNPQLFVNVLQYMKANNNLEKFDGNKYELTITSLTREERQTLSELDVTITERTRLAV